jgi:hypothetical protein
MSLCAQITWNPQGVTKKAFEVLSLISGSHHSNDQINKLDLSFILLF